MRQSQIFLFESKFNSVTRTSSYVPTICKFCTSCHPGLSENGRLHGIGILCPARLSRVQLLPAYKPQNWRHIYTAIQNVNRNNLLFSVVFWFSWFSGSWGSLVVAVPRISWFSAWGSRRSLVLVVLLSPVSPTTTVYNVVSPALSSQVIWWRNLEDWEEKF